MEAPVLEKRRQSGVMHRMSSHLSPFPNALDSYILILALTYNQMLTALQRVREVEVLKAARDESRRVLLVYANERAVSYESKELPHQLLVSRIARKSAYGQKLTLTRISLERTI